MCMKSITNDIIKKMKVGIIRETKIPEDNRVVLTPQQICLLREKYPGVDFFVQSSTVRVFNDEEYKKAGIAVVDDLNNCDVLFGVKEVDVNALLPDKHYFFFGHIAKKQLHNKPLIRKMMDLNITFTDYEYLVDENNIRLCAFGWWAGVVGVYNTLRAYGIKQNVFELAKPDRRFTLEYMLSEVRKHKLPPMKIIVTGNGRVSQGAQYFLDQVSIKKILPQEYLRLEEEVTPVYTVLSLAELVCCKEDKVCFERKHFKQNPALYKSAFLKYAQTTDVFIPCHFWGANDPVYLSETDLRNESLRIKVIGDVTCDINGSVESTLRPSTHENPFYDYNPILGSEEESFSSDANITIMAVDTLPNALAYDTSRYFGEMLIDFIFDDVVHKTVLDSKVLDRATILKDGKLTERFKYLEDYAKLGIE